MLPHLRLLNILLRLGDVSELEVTLGEVPEDG